MYLKESHVLKKNNTNDIMKIISFVLGGFFILIGAYQVISYFLSGGKYDFYDNSLIYGIIIIVVGVVTLVYSETISSILRIIIGIWILYSSLIRMNLAFKLKSMELGVWGPSFILAGIMFICGMIDEVNYILIRGET